MTPVPPPRGVAEVGRGGKRVRGGEGAGVRVGGGAGVEVGDEVGVAVEVGEAARVGETGSGVGRRASWAGGTVTRARGRERRPVPKTKRLRSARPPRVKSAAPALARLIIGELHRGDSALTRATEEVEFAAVALEDALDD